MNKPKRIPYSITNFEKIRKENYLYVDKTRFIEMLENEPTAYHFLLRPRKFGKSLFLSVLEHYYDLRFKDNFDELFGEFYIGQNPTPKRNSYFVMKFDFSAIDTSSVENFKVSFTEAVRSSVGFFLIEHKSIIDDYKERDKELKTIETVRGLIEYALKIIQSLDSKAYIIIDEYDHFANDIIAKGTQMSKNQYQESVWANSLTKDFYETLKSGSKSVIDKMFVTGITPIMLDDLTSGFNISDNLSVKPKYNELLGLTREEVAWVIEQICLDKSLIALDLEKMYNGYLFHKKAKNKLFNSTMIFNYLHGLLSEGTDFEYIVDDNLKTDYSRIGNLINKFGNKEKLRELAENNSVGAEIVKQFSITQIHEENNFLSLLYYMGLVTIDITNPFNIGLSIPNYAVKTIFWNLIQSMLMEEVDGLSLDNSKYKSPIYSLAYENRYDLFFEYFSKHIVSYLSNIDLQKTIEKDMKFLLLPMFLTTNYYFPISEMENSGGYTDIYLQRSYLHPNTISEWVWEIKYIPQKESDNKKLIEEKKKEAKEQIERYKSSNFFKNKKDVRFLVVIFTGKSGYEVEELGIRN